MLFAETAVDATTGWAAAVAAVAVTLGLVCQIVLQVMARADAKRTAEQAGEDAAAAQAAALAAAREAKKVGDTLADTTVSVERKLDAIAQTGQEVHTLVNAAMGQALRTAAIALRRLAKDGSAEDVAAAESAERSLRAHEHKQAIVDRGGKT